MSSERSERKKRLNARANVIKNIGCCFCSNNKMHSDGKRMWCTKCKKDKSKPLNT